MAVWTETSAARAFLEVDYESISGILHIICFGMNYTIRAARGHVCARALRTKDYLWKIVLVVRYARKQRFAYSALGVYDFNLVIVQSLSFIDVGMRASAFRFRMVLWNLKARVLDSF